VSLDQDHSQGNEIAYSSPGSHSRRVSELPESAGYEDPEVIKRHLVQPEDAKHPEGGTSSIQGRGSSRHGSQSAHPELGGFSSLQLQGGDTTREIYRWAQKEEKKKAPRAQRSMSFHELPSKQPNGDKDIRNIKAPGGLRRDFLQRNGRTESPRPRAYGTTNGTIDVERSPAPAPPMTSNFLEFLTLYGHFAGEELEEESDGDEYFDYQGNTSGEAGEDDETTGLMTTRTPRTPSGKRSRRGTALHTGGNSSRLAAALTLLKSFVGTGVLFLPRAFFNGGMTFSSLVLIAIAALSYYCFILLVTTQLKTGGSFGGMGAMLYGPLMRYLILGSLILSQVGFVAAYLVFVSENLRAFVSAVSRCETFIDVKWIILMQLVVLLPFSLFRDISKLSITAYIADFFIVLGLLYLYTADIQTLSTNGGIADIIQFNENSWTLFIGTAIFTFEGIGLILPIQESMKEPTQFPFVLGLIMVIITVLFTSVGALSYAAFGSSTKTVILLNFPQDSKFVNAVQFLYSLAILLSTPLQLFPAIRILETSIFGRRSGKENIKVKWEKNLFRFTLVAMCALIAWGGADDLDKFVALVGSFACIPLVYIYPVSPSRAIITPSLSDQC